jgi:hypothetical protein
MQYWKRIKIKNFEIIQKKTLEFIQRQDDILDKSKYRGPFINLQHLGYFREVPEVSEAFYSHGLAIEDANIYLMYKNSDSMPHKDYTDSIARVNIPILNCEGTWTTFYENVQSKRLVLPTGAPFYATTNRDYVEVDRVETNQPTIVRISEGHNVIMDETRSPRIMLTLSFNPDAGLLLED